MKLLRISEEEEKLGIDNVEQGGEAYHINENKDDNENKDNDNDENKNKNENDENKDSDNTNIQVTEINHGEKLKINSYLSLRAFLSGPFLTDSAILIQHKNDFILNINDSKQQKLMANHILSSIGDGNLKVMLRSHASANSRICIKNRDGTKKSNFLQPHVKNLQNTLR